MDTPHQAPALTLPEGTSQDGWEVTVPDLPRMIEVLKAIPEEFDDEFSILVTDPVEQAKVWAMVMELKDRS